MDTDTVRLTRTRPGVYEVERDGRRFRVERGTYGWWYGEVWYALIPGDGHRVRTLAEARERIAARLAVA